MIVHYDKTTDMFELANDSNTIYLYGFPSLFSYKKEFLEKIFSIWPESKHQVKLLSKRKTTKQCMVIFESKHGKMFFLVYALFPIIKKENGELRTEQITTKKAVDFMYSQIHSIHSRKIICVSMSSLASSVITEYEWLSFFASSKKQFAIYK